MCGICGIVVGPDEAGHREEGQPSGLEPMLRRLGHRGPDHEGEYRMHGCRFGHRRLAIIDLSAAGNQPMVTGDGQLMVVFNGEIYNHKELRRVLEGEGYVFSSRTDTEVLLHGYRHWGAGLVGRLKGMFALAVWDAEKRTLLAARDPLGKKPFAWYYDRGTFYFASEIGALVSGIPARPDIDLGAVEDYLRYRYVPGNRSVYRGVQKLPPGHMLRYSPSTGAGPLTEAYLTPRYRSETTTTLDGAVEWIDSLLTEAVARRLESDVPMAALLSGGLDSSLIVAIAAQKLGIGWKTIHARFSNDREGEAHYAERVAKHCRTEHREIELSPEHTMMLPRVLNSFSEPYADDSALPSHYVYAALKEHATVAISGDGGDELFAGYLHARGFMWRDKLGRWPMLSWAAAAVEGVYPGYRCHRGLRQAVSLARYLGMKSPRAFALTRSTAWNREAARLLRGQGGGQPYLENAFHNADGGSDFERMLLADIATTLPDAYLVKVDRSSMASAVEVRCPLLDWNLLRAAQTVPRSVLMHGGHPKALEQRIAEKYLPRDVIYRSKRGFSIPLEQFLQSFVPDLLTRVVHAPGSFSTEYLDLDLLDRQIAKFSRGASYLSYRLWSVICLEVWYRLHYLQDIDRETSFAEMC